MKQETIQAKMPEKKKVEEKKVEEKPAKAPEKKEEKKKEEAIAKGSDLNISPKHSIAICRFIKGKNIDKAMEQIAQITIKKRAIPMKGEIPHRKGMESGRYPVKAAKVFIKLLKSLAANSSVNGLENPYIHTAKADRASRPYRRFGSRRFKRTNVLLIAKERKQAKPQKEKPKTEKKKEIKKPEEKK